MLMHKRLALNIDARASSGQMGGSRTAPVLTLTSQQNAAEGPRVLARRGSMDAQHIIFVMRVSVRSTAQAIIALVRTAGFAGPTVSHGPGADNICDMWQTHAAAALPAATVLEPQPGGSREGMWEKLALIVTLGSEPATAASLPCPSQIDRLLNPVSLPRN